MLRALFVAIDSTKLGSYEASKSKKEIIDDGNHPNWGMKRDTNGNNGLLRCFCFFIFRKLNYARFSAHRVLKRLIK
ncbi:MAG: hypothetical protein U9Q80_08160 [Bacillota bacterium]|nr:hypothetical protein [Bacillota bacterium]